MSTEDEDADTLSSKDSALVTTRADHVRTVLLLVLSAAVLVVGAWVLAPRSIPDALKTSIPGVILGSRWVVGVVRLVGGVACLFVVASIVVRSWRGQWLSRLGPGGAAVGTAVDAVNDGREDARDELARAKSTIADLQQQLKASLGPDEEQVDPDAPR